MKRINKLASAYMVSIFGEVIWYLWMNVFVIALIMNGIRSMDMPLSAKRIFSELLLTHFDLLIDVYNSINSHDYIALKYVENSWTWLEIQVDNDILVLSELNYEIRIKTINFMKDIQGINSSILGSVFFSKVSNFYNFHKLEMD
ncbi:hypothetical protein J2T20_001140 [Paenibacillus wynnii]|nr:hypothetical protein [Paenibacillus wynnii]